MLSWWIAAAAPTAAHASSAPPAGRVAVLPIDAVGEIDPSGLDSATEGLISGLRRGGLEVVEAAAMAGGSSENGIYVLHTTLTKTEGDFEIQLDLRLPENDAIVATVEAVCEICGEAELSERLADAAASMQPRIVALRPKLATLEIAGMPTGASVYVDGDLAGEAPMTVELAPGDHVLRVEKGGHVAQERRWAASPGVRERIAYDLPEAARPGPHPAVGWTIFALGLGSAGASVPMFVLDERPYRRGCEGVEDVNGRCPDRYATKEAGIALAAAGAAAVVTGIVVLAYSYHARKAPRIGVVPGGMGWQF